MKNLTESQKQQLLNHMQKYQDDTWVEHAAWATRNFGMEVTADDCCQLFVMDCYPC